MTQNGRIMYILTSLTQMGHTITTAKIGILQLKLTEHLIMVF